ncbi:MAG TPA: prolipoprotein diacylglyceryl transferase family protein [Methyloceanibacter sp.]|nr:prolipoprotein diacylglyceryl transferase family protein [Methyloceanibacter sp.]
MNQPSSASPADSGPRYPRYFWIAGQWVNSFKVFLCVGVYLGILVIAALAQSRGIPPLGVGLGALALAIIGLAGARAYHLLVYHQRYFGRNAFQNLWNSKDGGWSVFGAFLAIAPCSFAVAHLLKVPAAVFWDLLSAGILAGGFWARLGCAFNGCCGGRETCGWCGLCLHDTRGVRRRRVPVQLLEMAWLLLGGIGFIWLWPKSLLPGNYALGVLTWYGLGRFFLEPLREAPDLIAGRVRINQCVAAALFLVAGGALLARALAS